MGELNHEQLKACAPQKGVSLVLAGAGTGKTRTLIEKAGSLLRSGVAGPGEIMILTFSRKAAEEIRMRVVEDIGECAAGITAGTFHHVALVILREQGAGYLRYKGYREFPVILDEISRNELLEGILRANKDRFLGIPLSIIIGIIVGSISPDRLMYKKLGYMGINGAIEEYARWYKEMKYRRGFMDYDDIIACTIELLKTKPDVREAIRSRFRYILVDEFQDTSDDTFELIRLFLPEDGGNLFAVGDDWQSIYGFRNARIEYMVKIKRYFPRANVFRLRTNYRSRKEIVNASGAFIRRNRYRTRKKLFSWKGKGGSLLCRHVSDFSEEIEVIHEILKSEHEKHGDNSLAVLFRNNWQVDYIRGALWREGILEMNPGAQFMTMHASKGLEFDAVIIAGVSDSVIPDGSSSLEEERRLMYVAMTRAKERLYILSHRNARGGVSRFGRELGFG